MDVLVRLNNQTAGRDKIVRLCQYGSRAGWYYTQKKSGAWNSNDVLKSLEYTFSSFRKRNPNWILRFGRCLDNIHSAISALNYPNLVIRITLTLSKLTNALYLLADHMIWIGRVGLFKINLDKWNTMANKYWLITIIMNLMRDVYELIQIIEQHNLLRGSKSFSSKSFRYYKYQNLFYLSNHKDVLLDTVKNICDLFIPLTAVGYTKINPGLIGILGFISSAIGIYCLIDPLAKLTPS